MIEKANINLISLNLRDIIHAEIVRKVKRRLYKPYKKKRGKLAFKSLEGRSNQTN